MTLDAQQTWALLKTAVFTLVAPCVVALWLPYRLHWAYTVVSDTSPVPNVYAIFCSYPVFLFGIGLYFWCAWNFATKGLGSPAPIDEPKHLVVQGPYRYVRNPMYLGVLAVVVAQAVFWWSLPLLLYLAFVTACCHLFVLVYEEPHLKKVFGAEYEDYCRRVHRWLPRFRPAE